MSQAVGIPCGFEGAHDRQGAVDLYDLVRSGRVRRWHSNPDLAHSGETNGHHQWVVASLILALHPEPSPALVREALWHDVGELRAGDLPAPFKDANPEIAAAHAQYEHACRRDICGAIWLDAREACWLNFCDRLAAYLWMLSFAPAQGARADWVAMSGRIEGVARQLGVGDRVASLIGMMRGGP